MRTYKQLVVRLVYLDDKDVITESSDNVGAWQNSWDDYFGEGK